MVKDHLIQVPIFPLPTSILYPGIYVPLHIYEERYKLMLKHIEGTGTHLAISFAPELQPDKFFPHMVCGAGPVRILKKFENGETDILVFGTQRVKFNRYIQELPFLIGEKDLLEQIRNMLINWIFAKFDDSSRPIQFFKTVNDLEPLCNFVAYYFVSDFDKKQKLLEENLLENKAQVIWKVLKDIEESGAPGPQSGPKGSPLIFPMGNAGKKNDDFN